MSASGAPERPEVVLVTRPALDSDAPYDPSPAEVLRDVVSHSIGLAMFTASTAVGITQQAVGMLAEGLKVWELLGFHNYTEFGAKFKEDSYLLGLRLNGGGANTGNFAMWGSFIQG